MKRRNGADWMPYRQQPTREEVWARFMWNLVRLPLPWRWRDINPYVLDGEGNLKPKSRTAWEDITHSVENVYVEWRRRKSKAGIPD